MATSDSPSLRQLLLKAKNDATRLVTAQIELARLEVQATGKAVGRTGLLAISTAFIAVLFIIFLLITLAYGIVAAGLPLWASFGIVALFLLLVTAILGLMTKSSAKNIKGPGAVVDEIEKTKRILEA